MLENQMNMLVEDNSSYAHMENNEEYDTCLLDIVINGSNEKAINNQLTPPRKKMHSGMDMGTVLRTGSSNHDVVTTKNTMKLRERRDTNNYTCSTA